MINNFNNIILKIFFLKKNLIISYKNLKKTNFSNKIQKTNFSALDLENTFKNKNWIIFNKKVFSIKLFLSFFVFIFNLKIQFLKFKKEYLNNFLKKSYLFSSSFFNYYVKNNLLFYKNFNKVYISKTKKRFKKHKIKYFNFKKVKNNNSNMLAEARVFSNFDSFFNKNVKLVKKRKKIKKVNLDFYENIFFENSKIFGSITLNLNCDLPLSKNAINDILYFYKNIKFKWDKKPKPKPKPKYNKKKKKSKKKTIYSSKFRFNNKSIDLLVFNFFRKFKTRFYPLKYKKIFHSKKVFNYQVLYLSIFVIEFFKINLFKNNLIISINKVKNSNFIIFFKKEKNLKTSFDKNIKSAFKNLIYLNDFYLNNTFFHNKLPSVISVISNNFFLKNLKILNGIYFSDFFVKKALKSNNKLNLYYYNNYYPAFYTNSISKKLFFSKFSYSISSNYFLYMNFYVLSFLEKISKKKFYLKVTTNHFNKPPFFKFLRKIFNENKILQLKNQPKYMKNYFMVDFLEILWYSLYLKDLTILSEWICKFLEKTHFRFHRKFVLFFNNFMNKYSITFFTVLNIKGFFFDIRGKVGVSGNAKKRHLFFKIGSIKRSEKSRKIEFKHAIVRTPTGALGLTFIISY